MMQNVQNISDSKWLSWERERERDRAIEREKERENL